MSEYVTAAACRAWACNMYNERFDECSGFLHCAAATIEALQARVAELEGKFGDALLDAAYAEGRLDVAKQQIDELEAIPPSSPDTDEAREALDDLLQHAEGHLEGGYYDDGLFGQAAVEADRLRRPALDALDASRAEFEKLRQPLVDLYTEWCNRSDEAADEGFSFDRYWLGKLTEVLWEAGE